MMISLIGKLLARPDVLTRNQADIPPVHRLVIDVMGGHGEGVITGCELFSSRNDQPLESDDAEFLLETRLPILEGREPMSIRRLLEDAVLLLLAARDPDWSEGDPTGGRVEIGWQSLPNGEILTAFGGALRDSTGDLPDTCGSLT